MSTELQLLVDGVDFGEGPRWNDGRLWYSDFHQRTIYSVSADGERRVEVSDLDDMPSGLGWLPDGRLVFVAMRSRQLRRLDPEGVVLHADLSSVATGPCNDMVMAADGTAYVGNFGFDMFSGESFTTADLALVAPDGTVEVAARGLRFPNGSVITPDGATLIVGESFGQAYQAFPIGPDGRLGEQREWASVRGTAPDGCSLDAAGGIWCADARGSRIVRIVEGGDITAVIETPMPTFACALGGDDGRTLFVLCAPSSAPDDTAGKAAGAIYTTRVEHPHAGLP